MTTSTIYSAEPALLEQLVGIGAAAIRRRRVTGSVDADAIAEIDRITDHLAALGLCRPRDDDRQLSAERARLGWVGKATKEGA